MTAEGAVDLAEFLHDHGVPHGHLHLAADALVAQHALASGHEAGGALLEGVGVGGVHDLHALQGDPGLLGGGGDDVSGGDQHRCADAVVGHAAGGLQGLDGLALGHGHAAGGGGLGLLGELLDEVHLLGPFYRKRARSQARSAWLRALGQLHGEGVVYELGGVGEGGALVQLHVGDLDLVLVLEGRGKLHDVDGLAVQVVNRSWWPRRGWRGRRQRCRRPCS